MNCEVKIPSRKFLEFHMINDGRSQHGRTHSKSYAAKYGELVVFKAWLKSRVMDVEKALSATTTPDKDRSLQGYPKSFADFDGPKDPDNPLNWSTAYKWSILVLISVMSLVV